MISKHGGTGFICSLCNFKTERKHGLLLHQEKSQANHFSCTSCAKKDMSCEEFAKHYNEEHPDWICSRCNKYLSSMAKKWEHIEKKHTQGPEKVKVVRSCELCGKTGSSSVLSQHMRFQHGRNRKVGLATKLGVLGATQCWGRWQGARAEQVAKEFQVSIGTVRNIWSQRAQLVTDRTR